MSCFVQRISMVDGSIASEGGSFVERVDGRVGWSGMFGVKKRRRRVCARRRIRSDVFWAKKRALSGDPCKTAAQSRPDRKRHVGTSFNTSERDSVCSLTHTRCAWETDRPRQQDDDENTLPSLRVV